MLQNSFVIFLSCFSHFPPPIPLVLFLLGPHPAYRHCSTALLIAIMLHLGPGLVYRGKDSTTEPPSVPDSKVLLRHQNQSTQTRATITQRLRGWQRHSWHICSYIAWYLKNKHPNHQFSCLNSFHFIFNSYFWLVLF